MLENLLTIKETSETLYKLGFRAETCFSYRWNKFDKKWKADYWYPEKSDIRAYTFQTLWERLPKKIEIEHGVYAYLEMNEEGIYYTFYPETVDTEKVIWFIAMNDNKAEAAGKALKWCIKEGYCNVKN